MRFAIVMIMLLGLIAANDAFAHKGKVKHHDDKGWTVLGSKKVAWNVDKDVLPVGVSEGGFTKLKVKVTGGTVHMIRMVVTYGNGTKDEIPLKHIFKKGDTSRIIDLQGGKRIIKKITFVYDRKHIAKKAKVWVAGKK